MPGIHNNAFWRSKLAPYKIKSNAFASWQVLTTLVPIMLAWSFYFLFLEQAIILFVPFCIILVLFIMRSFVLMHDCGHYSLFSSKHGNQLAGFILGVITGMPQMVWAKNHNYHHKTNGDWIRYGGVFNILPVDRYNLLSAKKKERYWRLRQPLILIPAGFFYVLFNPRFNWIIGTVILGYQTIQQLVFLNFSKAKSIVENCKSRYWKTPKDFRHMTYNNLALLCIWYLASESIGPAKFFPLYITSTAIAGSLGILLFTIQHNFEGSYASDTHRVDHHRAAIEGTSMIMLPKVLNWFTADIAYHHLHHLSPSIPNYNLARCHRDNEHLFSRVKRVRLREVLSTFDYQLWDKDKEMVVSKLALSDFPIYNDNSFK